MSEVSDLLRRAWRKSARGEDLTPQERVAINDHQRKFVQHKLYFTDAVAKERLQRMAKADGYRNFSSWILQRVEDGIAAEGLDAAYLAKVEKELEKLKKQYDQLNELYVETASKSLTMQEDNRKLSTQLARLLRHVFPDEDADTKEA